MSFLGEIKRRKVFQVAAVYAVVAWLIIQIVDVVSEPLSLPGWFDTVTIVLLAIGFPIAVIVAWAYDLTPQGIRRDSEVETSGALISSGGQRLNYLLQLLVLLAVGFLVVDQYLPEPQRASSAVGGSTGVTRLEFSHPSLVGAGGTMLTVSPDGQKVVYRTTDGLYVRPLSALEPRLIVGAVLNPQGPFFYPSGDAIAYVEAGQLKRVPVEGGAPLSITDGIVNLVGLAWTEDGRTLIGQRDGIYLIPNDGSKPPKLLIPAAEGRRLLGPQLLPGGDLVLYSSAVPGEWDEGEVIVQSLESGERHVLFRGGSSVQYVPTDHLIYAVGNALFARSFDPETLQVSGKAVPVIEGVSRASQAWRSGGTAYHISKNGTLAYLASGPEASSSVVWVDRDGSETLVPVERRNYGRLDFSNDGTRVALDERGPENDIWVYSFSNETETRLNLGPNGGDWPLWMPGDGGIVYHPGTGEIVDWQTPNNVGEPARFASGRILDTNTFHPETFASSGSELLVTVTAEGGWDIASVSMDSKGEPSWLLRAPGIQSSASISPNGRWMAYVSYESGRPEVYVRPYPELQTDASPVSGQGGVSPVWSRDGRELFYIQGDSQTTGRTLMSVIVEPDTDQFSYNARTPLMNWPYRASYDISLDGTRFLAIKREQDAVSTRRIIVVRNWFEELERLLPME